MGIKRGGMWDEVDRSPKGGRGKEVSQTQGELHPKYSQAPKE